MYYTNNEVEILTFLAHCMNSVLIIVKPCTNGLGYVIVDAFCSDDVDVNQSAYYVRVSGGGHLFDALSVYGATEENEIESTEYMDTVVREFLQLPRVSWNVLQREALNSSANSSKPAYSTPKGIILAVPCLPEDVNSESSILSSLSCNSVLQQVDDSRKVEEPQRDESEMVEEPQSDESGMVQEPQSDESKKVQEPQSDESESDQEPEQREEKCLRGAGGQDVEPYLSLNVRACLIISSKIQHYYVDGISDSIQHLTVSSHNHKILYWNTAINYKHNKFLEIKAFTFCTQECESHTSDKYIYLGTICNRSSFTSGQCYVYNTHRGLVEILPPCKLREVRETREVAKAVADILKEKVKKLVELWDNVQAKPKKNWL